MISTILEFLFAIIAKLVVLLLLIGLIVFFILVIKDAINTKL
jgi:hypothetical protein